MYDHTNFDYSQFQFTAELIEETQKVLENDYGKPFSAEETSDVLSFYAKLFMCLEEAKRRMERE
jgi:hypothetical protein